MKTLNNEKLFAQVAIEYLLIIVGIIGVVTIVSLFPTNLMTSITQTIGDKLNLENENNIVLLTPDNDEYSAGTITFVYKPQSNTEINLCNLIIDGQPIDSNDNIRKNEENFFEQNVETFSNGTYNWNIKCQDSNNNWFEGTQKYFDVNKLIFANIITLLTPNNDEYSTGIITFIYKPQSNTEINYCGLLINDNWIDSNYNIRKNEENFFEQNVETFSNGTHNWNIQCQDSNNNLFEGTQKYFVINDLIEIYNLHDLNRVREKLNGNYILMNNIDATPTREWNNGLGWEPIGNCGLNESCISTNGGNMQFAFNGTLNGNNFAIQKLYINRPDENFIGLIGVTSNAKIDKLKLTDNNIFGKHYTGGIIGYNANSTITNSQTTGNTTGKTYTGGIIGFDYDSNITNSQTTGNTTGTEAVGGITGYSFVSTITNSYTTGNTTGETYTGGITGIAYASMTTDSYTTGNTTGTENVGGITGRNDNSTITNSFTIGKTNGETYVGGITGYNNNASITNSHTAGDTNGLNYVGGIIGYNLRITNPHLPTYYPTIKNLYTTGNTTGENYIGGITGANFNSLITNAYTTGITNGKLWIGGITGYNSDSNITNSYASGNITGDYEKGGITGSNTTDSNITNCYWDITRTNQTVCCGNGNCNNCFGKNNDNSEPDAFFPKIDGDYNVPMQHNSNPENDWNFVNDWMRVNDNYPILK